MALRKHSEGYISDRNGIFADLKMVKWTGNKYHWEMESQPKNIQGTYKNNEGGFIIWNLRKHGYYVYSNYLGVMKYRNEERAQWEPEESINGWISKHTFTKDNMGQ